MKKKYILIVICLFLFCNLSLASKYGLYSPENYNYSTEAGEQLLFILDLSNSMNESLENSSKYKLMLKTMREILPKISPDTKVGLRVYGQRMGFTPLEACRATTLAAPISTNNSGIINFALQKYKPRGMTPITFSLKQAIKYDFMGFNGKKHIILMTDGGENCDESPCKFVMGLVKLRRDIQIDVIAFNLRNSDDIEQLQCTALVTSGKFYNAKTSAELLKSFDKSIQGVKNVEAKIVLPKN